MNNVNASDFYGCFLGCDPSNVFDHVSVCETKEILSLISPVPPSGRKLVRIGKNSDGSYLMPDDFAGITACFSPGVDNFKVFEDCLVNRYDIQCHMCDASSSPELFKTPIIEGRQTFMKKWLDVTGDDNSITLAEWIEATSPEVNGDLIIQMDIEGAEYRNILETDESILSKFRIMVIEFHGLEKISDERVRRNVLLPVFRKLNKMFKVVHAHPNNYDGEFVVPGTNMHLPRYLELTLYRNDRIEANRNIRTARALIPHPKDIVNCPGKPPVFLDRQLLCSKRSWRSRLKILRDRSYYYARSVARRTRDKFLERGNIC